MPDADRVLRLLSELEAWRDQPDLVLLWPCPRCAAPKGVSCVRTDGRKSRPHARRLDIRNHAQGSLTPLTHRQALADGAPPLQILARIQRTALYRRLVELGEVERLAGVGYEAQRAM